LAQSGSALDLLRESASQGAMTKAVLGEQGLITEAGYQEQAKSYTDMASAAGVAIDADKLAAKGAYVAAGFSAAAAVASVFTGGGGSLPNLTPPGSGDYSGVGGWGPATIG
jgi:hypothetical protein